MSAGAFGSLLLDTAQHYTDKVIDYSNQKNFNRQEQSNFVKNQNMLYQLGQQAQRNAAKNEVQGLINAGLSPALAKGEMSGNVAVAPSVGHTEWKGGSFSPSKSLQAGEELSNLAEQRETMQKQRELMETQANLNKAKTEQTGSQTNLVDSQRQKVEQEIHDWNTYSKVLTEQTISQLEKRLDGLKPDSSEFKELSSRVDSLKSGLDSVSKASLDALVHWSESGAKVDEANARKLAAQNESIVESLLRENGSLYFQAKMPEQAYRQISADISKTYADIARLAIEKQLTEQELKNIADRLEMDKATNSQYLISQGRYGDAVVNEALNLLHLGEDVAGGVVKAGAAAKAFSKGQRMRDNAEREFRSQSAREERAYKTQSAREERAWKTKRDTKQFEREKYLRGLDDSEIYEDESTSQFQKSVSHRRRK